MIRSLAMHAFERAMDDNLAGIERALAAAAPIDRLLDVGCDNGERTLAFGAAARAVEIHGVEAVTERAALARRHGVEVVTADVAGGLPYADASFDAVVSNQVIEHVHDTDLFVREVARVLRPSGLAAISTENLASWHNIAALALGWQPFSLTNVSSAVTGLGNPAALHRGAKHVRPSSWKHVRVFAFRGLRELLEAHGLVVLDVLGAGYFPLPRSLAKLDPRHAALITAVARKPGAISASGTPR